MVNLIINGRQIKAEEGSTILYAARESNIYIPTLCENEAVAPYGACRLCTVEITTARGRQRLVASCLYPVEEGLTVRTESERLAQNRRVLIELLLSRCPESDVIRDMALQLGVEKARFPSQKGNNKCILCALCTRVCEEVVGVSAISLTNRGVDRIMTTPFSADLSETCIGCGSCSYVCPTDAISMIESDGIRTIKWPHNQMEHKMRKCQVCGQYWATEREIEHMARVSGTRPEDYAVCTNCRP